MIEKTRNNSKARFLLKIFKQCLISEKRMFLHTGVNKIYLYRINADETVKVEATLLALPTTL